MGEEMSKTAPRWKNTKYHGYKVTSCGLVMGPSGRILKQSMVRGYKHIMICRNGSMKNKYVHSLVAETFLGARPPKHDVNHKDSNKTNNNIKNLEYVTEKENSNHFHNFSRCRLKIRPHNTSGYVGVSFSKHHGTWRAELTVRQKKVYLKYFKSKADAISARKKAEKAWTT